MLFAGRAVLRCGAIIAHEANIKSEIWGDRVAFLLCLWRRGGLGLCELVGRGWAKGLMRLFIICVYGMVYDISRVYFWTKAKNRCTMGGNFVGG